MAPWPGLLMPLIAFAAYAGCKWLTWRRAWWAMNDVPVWRQAAYLLAWPGMNAAAFLGGASSRSVPAAEWGAAAGRTVVGLIVTFGVTLTIPADHPMLAAWVGGAGLILAFHFGVLHLLSCAWRQAGVRADPVMNRPWAATSIGDFWGRRWNMAFRDVTHQFVFRPLASRFGARAALLGAFLFSGVIHDLVISVPAIGGFGRPTIYFAIQGAAVMLERSRLGRTLGLDRGLGGRLFGAVVLFAPVGLLFHPLFISRVWLPWLYIIRALSWNQFRFLLQHFIGYVNLTHLGPAVVGALVLAAGLALTFRPWGLGPRAPRWLPASTSGWLRRRRRCAAARRPAPPDRAARPPRLCHRHRLLRARHRRRRAAVSPAACLCRRAPGSAQTLSPACSGTAPTPPDPDS
jgi:hypothetical protein